jgi:hypothetical protein
MYLRIKFCTAVIHSLAKLSSCGRHVVVAARLTKNIHKHFLIFVHNTCKKLVPNSKDESVKTDMFMGVNTPRLSWGPVWPIKDNVRKSKGRNYSIRN